MYEFWIGMMFCALITFGCLCIWYTLPNEVEYSEESPEYYEYIKRVEQME